MKLNMKFKETKKLWIVTFIMSHVKQCEMICYSSFNCILLHSLIFLKTILITLNVVLYNDYFLAKLDLILKIIIGLLNT